MLMMLASIRDLGRPGSLLADAHDAGRYSGIWAGGPAS